MPLLRLLAFLVFACGFRSHAQETADSLDTDEPEYLLEAAPVRYIPPFFALDSIAHTIGYNGDLAKTVYDLTSNYDSELEKTRAIFAWVTFNIAYDYKSYNKGKKPKFPKCDGRDDCAAKYAKWESDYIDDVLKHKKGVCDGYARLFNRMCGYAGIRSDVVPGYVKRSPYAIGRMGSMNHAWNIVIIDEKKYYLDATWAAGYCTVGDNGKLKGYTRWFNDYYWLTPNDRMLRNHFPKDTIWPNTSKADKIKYRDQPYINSRYLSVLDVLSPDTGKLKVKVCDTIRFKLDLHYLVQKMQINTNIAKNPSVWMLQDGQEVKNPRAMKKQQYVGFRVKDFIYEFEYEVVDKNLRYIEVLFDYETVLKFKVELIRDQDVALP